MGGGGAAGQSALALGAAALMVGQQLQGMDGGFAEGLTKMPGGGGEGWLGWFGLGGMRNYLNVSHRYVWERVVQLIFPFAANRFAYSGMAGTDFGSSEAALRLTAEPWRSADLYVPMMALMTYVILYAAGRGGSDFHPDILYDTAAFAGLLVGVEVGVARTSCYLLGMPSLAFWESAGVAGYKFVHLSVVLFFRLVFLRGGEQVSLVYWSLFTYLAVAAAVATFNFLRQPLKVTPHVSPVANYVLLAVAGLQLPLLWLLQRSL